ncbi:MAG: cytochrome ubiquinol oxidase subunit I [Candidatus Aminicenantes bacterium]|nr:cytochrome ubiquinol oxidase subunit I [Candidatus Aminicenantes bacterium]
MDAVLLARIQFGFTAGFHFLFPPTTFGLTFIILLVESLYLKTKDDLYRRISSFLIKLLGIVFVLGVATGIVLEFAFGNNWSEYSRTVGDIFGAPLAAEGIFSFFLESVFLGILIFGRKKVSQKMYWFSAFLVFFASHLSGLWIIIANSWMQTPAGFRMEGTKAVLTNFFQAALNPSTMVRYLHVVLAGWITGSLFAAAISAWYILKKRHLIPARIILRLSLIVFIAASLLQLGSGHAHSVKVAETQPEKMAAFEALWETQKGAPMALFGFPDKQNQKTHLLVEVPKLLSLLIHFDPEAEVTGLDVFPADEQPPVFLPFVSYHLMILFGMVFIGLSLVGIYLLVRKKTHQTKWFLRSLLLALPLPYLANEWGWIAAEVGRQPWAVYRILRTADAVSPVVPSGNILLTLILFILVYALIGAVGLMVILKLIRKGLQELEKNQEGGRP